MTKVEPATIDFRLSIAGIDFVLSSPADLRVVERDPAYTSFVEQPETESTGLEIPIRLTLEAPPSTNGLEVLFDTVAAWRAIRDGEDLLITMKAPPGHEGHWWFVRLSADGPPYDLYCGEVLKARSGAELTVINPLRYPLDQVLMMYLLAPKKGVIVHAAGFQKGGVGALFAGVSGAGKSTLTELVSGQPDLLPLSDDRVVVRRIGDRVQVFGTPWPGEAGVASRASARLGSVVILRQADHHGMRPLDPREAFDRLLPTVSILWYDADLSTAALSWCHELLQEVPAYELSFRRDEGVVEVIEEHFDQLPG